MSSFEMALLELGYCKAALPPLFHSPEESPSTWSLSRTQSEAKANQRTGSLRHSCGSRWPSSNRVRLRMASATALLVMSTHSFPVWPEVMSFNKWMMSSAIFFVMVPRNHHLGPVGSLGCMEDARLTVMRCVFAPPPPAPSCLLALLLTCKVRAFAMQLRKTSAIPMSLGVMASDDDLARMPKSFGGNCTMPRRPAKVWGWTSGRMRLKIAEKGQSF